MIIANEYYSTKDYYKSALDIAIHYPGTPDSLKTMLWIQYNSMLVFIGESKLPTIEKILSLSSWGLPLFALFEGPAYVNYEIIMDRIIRKQKLPKELKKLIENSVIDLNLSFHCEDLLE